MAIVHLYLCVPVDIDEAETLREFIKQVNDDPDQDQLEELTLKYFKENRDELMMLTREATFDDYEENVTAEFEEW